MKGMDRLPNLLIAGIPKAGTGSLFSYLAPISRRMPTSAHRERRRSTVPTRPVVREDVPQLGDLLNEFDFSQRPAKPLILDPHPNKT